MLPIRSLPQPEFRTFLKDKARKATSKGELAVYQEYVHTDKEESPIHHQMSEDVWDAEWSYADESKSGSSLAQAWKRYRQMMKLFFRKGVVINMIA